MRSMVYDWEAYRNMDTTRERISYLFKSYVVFSLYWFQLCQLLLERSSGLGIPSETVAQRVFEAYYHIYLGLSLDYHRRFHLVPTSQYERPCNRQTVDWSLFCRHAYLSTRFFRLYPFEKKCWRMWKRREGILAWLQLFFMNHSAVSHSSDIHFSLVMVVLNGANYTCISIILSDA